MVAKRIIPCLDIKGGRTVKGTKFLNLRDMGDAVELAFGYDVAGADELVLLDISATEEERTALLEVVNAVGKAVTIPFTVGGGISTVAQVAALLSAGADKVSINSSAVREPALIDRLAREFGSQCIVVAIDSKCTPAGHEVFVQGGKKSTGRSTYEWAREVVERGAGEVLLTSIDHDGVRNGFACELTQGISTMVKVPVIASGGAGSASDFVNVFRSGGADAALAAGVFMREFSIFPRSKVSYSLKGLR